jgi:hypothetical protein
MIIERNKTIVLKINGFKLSLTDSNLLNFDDSFKIFNDYATIHGRKKDLSSDSSSNTYYGKIKFEFNNNDFTLKTFSGEFILDQDTIICDGKCSVLYATNTRIKGQMVDGLWEGKCNVFEDDCSERIITEYKKNAISRNYNIYCSSIHDILTFFDSKHIEYNDDEKNVLKAHSSSYDSTFYKSLRELPATREPEQSQYIITTVNDSKIGDWIIVNNAPDQTNEMRYTLKIFYKGKQCFSCTTTLSARLCADSHYHKEFGVKYNLLSTMSHKNFVTHIGTTCTNLLNLFNTDFVKASDDFFENVLKIINNDGILTYCKNVYSQDYIGHVEHFFSVDESNILSQIMKIIITPTIAYYQLNFLNKVMIHHDTNIYEFYSYTGNFNNAPLIFSYRTKKFKYFYESLSGSCKLFKYLQLCSHEVDENSYYYHKSRILKYRSENMIDSNNVCREAVLNFEDNEHYEENLINREKYERGKIRYSHNKKLLIVDDYDCMFIVSHNLPDENYETESFKFLSSDIHNIIDEKMKEVKFTTVETHEDDDA